MSVGRGEIGGGGSSGVEEVVVVVVLVLVYLDPSEEGKC